MVRIANLDIGELWFYDGYSAIIACVGPRTLAGGNRRKAAGLLSVSRATLYRKLKEHDLT